MRFHMLGQIAVGCQLEMNKSKTSHCVYDLETMQLIHLAYDSYNFGGNDLAIIL